MNKWIGITAALVVATCGCVKGTGRFGSSGEYLHNHHPVRVGYEASEPGTLLGSAWRLDNFTVKDARVGDQKLAGSYMSKRHYDLDDNGSYELDVEEARHDLRFEHRNTGALIWFALMPQSASQRDLELRVIARSVADDFSGGVGAVTVTPKGIILTSEQRYASVVARTAGCRLGSVEAYQADFVVADVDQLKLDPTSRSRRVRLLIARPGYTRTIGPSSTKLPVVLVAGMSSLPEDFPKHEADFGRFVAAIGLGGPHDKAPPAAPSGVTCDNPKSALPDETVPPSPATSSPPVAPPAVSAPAQP